MVATEDVPYRDTVIVTTLPEARGVKRRQSILEYMRIRHLIEAVAIEEKTTGQCLRYRTTAIRLKTGRLSDDTIEELMKADAVIVLVDPEDLTALAELSLRPILRGEMILVTKARTEAALPTMFRSPANIRADHGGGEKVLEWIREYAAEDTTESLDLTSPLPAGLQALMKEHDTHLGAQLREALSGMEYYGVPFSVLSDRAEYVSPWILGRALQCWSTLLPYSIWRLRWKGKKRGERYHPDLMVGAPTLVAGSEMFASVFLRQDFPEFPPDPDGPDALTLPAAMAALAANMEPDAYRAFVADQQRLALLVLNDGEARAEVPITLTKSHPDPDLQGKSLMPHLFGRRTMGSVSGPHATYLFIVYAEVV